MLPVATPVLEGISAQENNGTHGPDVDRTFGATVVDRSYLVGNNQPIDNKIHNLRQKVQAIANLASSILNDLKDIKTSTQQSALNWPARGRQLDRPAVAGSSWRYCCR